MHQLVAARRLKYPILYESRSRKILLQLHLLPTSCKWRPHHDPELMCTIAVEHFSNILAPSVLPQLTTSFNWFLQIQGFRCNHLQRAVLAGFPTELEISSTLLKLNLNKSPEPDGYTSAFFKSAWPIVGEETIAAINQFFISGFLPSSANATILTMVPKWPGAASISYYQPISCCNTIYKAISKILVKHLKVILPEVILPNQTAFIKGRLLIENTLLASEIVQGYHREGGPKWITIKVDIAKSFDTIMWEFIIQCLRGLNLPENFIHWIEACICTPSSRLSSMDLSMGTSEGREDFARGTPYRPTCLCWL